MTGIIQITRSRNKSIHLTDVEVTKIISRQKELSCLGNIRKSEYVRQKDRKTIMKKYINT